MRFALQIAVFLLLSLGVHMALAAIWAPEEPKALREKSIGGVALNVGALISTSRATVTPVVPVQNAAVAPEKTESLKPLAQDPLPHDIAPKITAKNAVVPKKVVKKAPAAPPKPKKKVAAKAAHLKPVEVKKLRPESVKKEVVERKPTEKMVIAEKVAPTVSDKEINRGGLVASNQGQKNMITGTDGKKITQGGNAEVTNYRGKVREILHNNKYYPKMAKRFRIVGQVIFTFTVHRDGQVSGLSILDSSGHTILDKAALRMVEISVPFAPFPSSITADVMEFRFPATYSLD